MARSRSSHEQKDLIERQEYFKNTVRRTLGPTIEQQRLDADSTDVAAPREQFPSYAPTRKTSAVTQYLRDHWPVIIITLVLLPVLGFLLLQLYTLNREVGEMKIRLEESLQRQERLEAQIDRINDKLEGESPGKRK